MKKFIKIASIVLITLFIIYQILSIFRYYYWTGRHTDNGYNFYYYVDLVNAALGIPGFHDDDNIIIEDSENRVNLTIEEWVALDNKNIKSVGGGSFASWSFNGQKLTKST